MRAPQRKLNSVAKPLSGNDRTKFFLDNMASGTVLGTGERGTNGWISPNIGNADVG